MKTLFQIAAELQGFFEKENWKFCFIGGISLQRWGEPRVTIDVDVTLLTGFGTEKEFINSLLAAYPSRIPDAAAFAEENRVLLLKSASGVAIDIALAALPFEEEACSRATRFEFLPGVNLLTCSAEDLVIMKAFANRPRDWSDIKGVITRQQGKLDKAYILERLTPLAEIKSAPEILQNLKDLFRA
ncbi:MAG: nucleotidyl transferase AbiEii/AbiGii toxin family protein [Elusimicrobiota bacterium]|nr:nucleotidyl transferase AbiEii/AbiGii toxin family protein [Elusimicrobiota bacterium]